MRPLRASLADSGISTLHMQRCILRPVDRLTRVFPTCLTSKIPGALTSYLQQSACKTALDIPVFSGVRVDDLFLGALLPLGETLVLANSLHSVRLTAGKETYHGYDRATGEDDRGMLLERWSVKLLVVRRVWLKSPRPLGRVCDCSPELTLPSPWFKEADCHPSRMLCRARKFSSHEYTQRPQQPTPHEISHHHRRPPPCLQRSQRRRPSQ